jgi:type I restriction enzyme S subunit
MSNASYVKLKEFCDVNQGLQIPISKRFIEDGENRYFYITVQFLKDSHLEKFYIETPPQSSICNEDDIIVVRTGSTGQIITGVNGCFHNNFFKINYDKKKVLGKYLYYCLTSKEKQMEMKRRAGITTIPDLNHFMFLDIEIPFLEYSDQLKATNILDVINKKIALNNKINTELEAMAKLIYDYWFVQFDFPDANGKPYKSSGGKMVYSEALKREIPDGWNVKELSDIAVIKAGGDKPKILSSEKNKDCSIPIYSNGIKNYGLYGYTRNAKINNPSITISARGTIGVSFLRMKPFVPIIRLIVVTPLNQNYLKYLDECLSNIAFENSGSVQKQLTAPQVSGLKIICPTDDLLEKFTSMVSSSVSEIEIIKDQSNELAKLRDWLLPMLMNGQVTVKDS